MESIILLEGKIIFNKIVNLSSMHNFEYTNMPTVKSNAKIKSPTNITNKTAKSPINITNNIDINNIKNYIELNKTTMTEETNRFKIVTAIIAIFILFSMGLVYFFQLSHK